MAHCLKDNYMRYFGETPWHGLGESMPALMTLPEAIQGHMTYPVSKEPVYRLIGGIPCPIEDQYVTVNMESGATLGMVGGQYEVYQTADRLELFSDLLHNDDGSGLIETAFALNDGQQFAIMARAKGLEGFEVASGDPIMPYLTISGSHDGSRSTEARYGSIRVVCANTLSQTMKGFKASLSVRTTINAPQRLEMGVRIMQEFQRYLIGQKETFSAFAKLQIDDSLIEAYLDDLAGSAYSLPEGRGRTLTQGRRDAILDLYEGKGLGSTMQGVKGTLYGLYNAAIEYGDRQFPQRGGGDRIASNLFGAASEFKQQAFDSAYAMVTR